jgi:hypothetical protein
VSLSSIGPVEPGSKKRSAAATATFAKLAKLSREEGEARKKEMKKEGMSNIDDKTDELPGLEVLEEMAGQEKQKAHDQEPLYDNGVMIPGPKASGTKPGNVERAFEANDTNGTVDLERDDDNVERAFKANDTNGTVDSDFSAKSDLEIETALDEGVVCANNIPILQTQNSNLEKASIEPEDEDDPFLFSGKKQDDTIFHDIAREQREKKATKANDAELPEYLWIEHLLDDADPAKNFDTSKWNAAHLAALPTLMEGLRNIRLKWWKKKVTLSFGDWLSKQFAAAKKPTIGPTVI